MLIDFSFSNFKSFRDEQAFSMQRVQRFVDGEDAYAGISTVAAIREIQFASGFCLHAGHGRNELRARQHR